MPCINASAIIDTIYININKIIHFHLFYSFIKCKGLRNVHNYLFIEKCIKRKKDTGKGKQTAIIIY